MRVVGNEADVDITQLIYDIKDVKKKIPDAVKVTSCLTFGQAMQNGKRLVEESGADFLMFTVYPFFAGLPIDEAKQNTIDQYNNAKNLSNGKPVIFGEVGWPSAGAAKDRAIPNVDNEKRYITDVTNATKDGQFETIFLFEAFDEPWKGAPGTWESSFGLWNKDGNPKFEVPPAH
jgi:glucan 1,3-beta-glucosidase